MKGHLGFHLQLFLRDICLIHRRSKSFAEDLSNDHTPSQTPFEQVLKIFKLLVRALPL